VLGKKFKLKHAIVLLACFVLVLGVIGCSQQTATNSSSDSSTTETTAKSATADTNVSSAFDTSVYKNNDFFITPEELKAQLGSDNLVLLDCNKPDVYAKEHISGAVSIGIAAFSDKVGKPGDPGWGTIKKKADLARTLQSFGIDNDKTVVFYSDAFQGPGADGRAVWQLKQAGMTNVKMLVGGLSYWKELGNEVTAEPAQAKATTNEVTLQDYDPSYSANKDYVFKNLGKQVLIDARTPKEFAGSQNAGEPRGGHIKGAINILWLDLLNKNGTPKTPDEIKAIMAKYNVTPETDFTVY
jgi:thiosulfate/3-mercaptopyruvate sulfurtransferase